MLATTTTASYQINGLFEQRHLYITYQDLCQPAAVSVLCHKSDPIDGAVLRAANSIKIIIDTLCI